MTTRSCLLFVSLAAFGVLSLATACGSPVPDAFAAPLPPARVEGYLGERMSWNLEYRLLKIDLDSLLQPFVQRPGAQAWVGEHAGKWLHAASLCWRDLGDSRLRERMDYVVAKLIAAQEPDGYLGTYLEKDRWTSWDVWSHKYNLIGLLAYHQATGDSRALEACRRMGDLLVATFGEGRRDIIRSGAHVGMAPTSVLEPMALLHRLTGKPEYAAFCDYIVRAWEQPHGPKLVSSLLDHGRVDLTANAKAYEMLSNLVGLLEFYRTTGNPSHLRAVVRAWEDIRAHQNYATGTSSWGELFQPPDRLHLGGTMRGRKFVAAGEGCVTVTWVQLNRALLAITGDPIYADELERSIYNALLAAQSPRDGTVSYFLPMLGRKRYGEVTHGIPPDVSCCASSIPRGLAMISGLAAGSVRGAAALLLYATGNFRVSVAGPAGAMTVSLAVETDFPLSGKVGVVVQPPTTAAFPLLLRVPAWCDDYVARIAGQEFRGRPGTFLRIDRTWQPGDRIEIELDLPMFTVPQGPGATPWFAVQRGPQVLATDEAVEPGALPEGWRGAQLYKVPASVNGGRSMLNLVPIADAGQTGGSYQAAFENLVPLLPDAMDALARYRAELERFRAEYGGARELPDVRFFLFGMGHRAKFIYRDGRLIDTRSGNVVREWPIQKDIIVPPDYRVTLDTTGRSRVEIVEDEHAVWIDEGGRRVALEGTRAPVKLPTFAGHRYARVLRVLHQELLVNITPAGPVPNFFVYPKPWYRDSAMMALAFQATGNVALIRDWILGLREPFDRNNRGDTEPDNLGQALFLVSLVSDRDHPLVSKVLAELPRFEREGPEGRYVIGRTDGRDRPVYQTKWLKYGLRALGLPDHYAAPLVPDAYSALFWMDYRDAHVAGKDAENRAAYPYLGWACDHFHGRKKSPIGNVDYPLTWEQRASQADYAKLAILDPVYVTQKLSAPHTWHAAEVFLHVLQVP